MNKLIFAMLIIGSVPSFFAQELSLTPHLTNNLSFFNPAFIGKDYLIQATAQHNIFSKIWTDRLPSQSLVAYEQRFDNINSGISIQASTNDFILMRRSSLLLGYSYVFRLKKEKTALRFGVSGGLRNLQSDVFPVGPDAYINKPNRFTINGGVAYTSGNLNIGYSFMQINGKHRWNEFSYPFTSVHTLYADYTFQLKRPKNTTLKSALITHYDGVGIDLYFVNRLNFNNRMYILAGYSNGRNNYYSYSVGIGFNFLEHFSMGYAFENRRMSMLNNNQFSQNHELVLGFRLIDKPKKRASFIGTPAF